VRIVRLIPKRRIVAELTPTLVLEQEQDYLLKVLRSRDGRFRTRIAEMYLGALHALGYRDNPERFSQAAQSMRELFDKLARQHEGEAIQLPKTWASDHMKAIGASLDSARKDSKCYEPAGDSWRGEIDPPVEDLLRSISKAVEKHRSNPGNAEVERRFLRGLEPAADPLPPDREGELLGQWRKYSKYFQDVAHHVQYPSASEFEQQMKDCTSFLLARLKLTAYTTLQLLDELISEEESNA
jgi:hypothetical protein